MSSYLLFINIALFIDYVHSQLLIKFLFLFFIFLESFDLLLLFFSIFIFNNFKTATVRTLFLCYYLRSSFIMFLVCISNDGTDVNTLEQSFFSGKSV